MKSNWPWKGGKQGLPDNVLQALLRLHAKVPFERLSRSKFGSIHVDMGVCSPIGRDHFYEGLLANNLLGDPESRPISYDYGPVGKGTTSEFYRQVKGAPLIYVTNKEGHMWLEKV